MFGVDVDATDASIIIGIDDDFPFDCKDIAQKTSVILGSILIIAGTIGACMGHYFDDIRGNTFACIVAFVVGAVSIFAALYCVTYFLLAFGNYFAWICLVFRKEALLKRSREAKSRDRRRLTLKPSYQIPEDEYPAYYEQALSDYNDEREERTILEVKYKNIRTWLILSLILLFAFCGFFYNAQKEVEQRRYQMHDQHDEIERLNDKNCELICEVAELEDELESLSYELEKVTYNAEHDLPLDTEY